MNDTLIWIIPYILSWALHGLWPFWAWWIMKFIFRIKKTWKVVIILATSYITITAISSGCPLVYLHEWLEVKMNWREKITYQYEDAIAYNYIIRPAQEVWKKIIQ